MLRSRIVGVGGYVPPHLVRNEDLEGPMEISAEAIARRTGIRQRYWADRDPRLATSDLALQASLRALEHAQLPKEAIDLIVVATLSPDMRLWHHRDCCRTMGSQMDHDRYVACGASVGAGSHHGRTISVLPVS